MNLKTMLATLSGCLCSVVILGQLVAATADQHRPVARMSHEPQIDQWNPDHYFKYSDIPTQQSNAQVNRRYKRSSPSAQNQQHQRSPTDTIDACPSKMEVITPYYATNAKGKLRTIVNSELMQQAIQVETCVRSQSGLKAKCNAQPDCGCEQKYKWHRLLVLDPRDPNASRGLFMDWFLFPSACQCRCKPGAAINRLLLLQPVASTSTTATRRRVEANS